MSNKQVIDDCEWMIIVLVCLQWELNVWLLEKIGCRLGEPMFPIDKEDGCEGIDLGIGW